MVDFPDLSHLQKNLLTNFYSKPKSKVLFNKAERDKIGLDFKKNKDLTKYKYLENSLPAFYFELLKAVNTKKIFNLLYSVNVSTLKQLLKNIHSQYFVSTVLKRRKK